MYSDYIVYLDESGDHGLQNCDMNYPVFVLVFCIFEKSVYHQRISPALQEIKFRHFGHDMIVFHEHEIRKANGDFRCLTDSEKRERFLADVEQWVRESEFTAIAIVIEKNQLKARYKAPENPYHLALRFGIERVDRFLRRKDNARGTVHVVCECRGKVEDDELELEFRRVCDGTTHRGKRLDFDIVFAHKRANSCGLQLADLIARPIGRHVLDPTQANRAYNTLEPKLDRSEQGVIEGYGIKRFP